MEYLSNALAQALNLFFAASPYILFGLVASGFIRVFLSPATVAAHLGKGRFMSVFKAAILGIPIPLCSCSVLPAAVALKKQGANNGATTAFMISAPESGVDSLAVSWALLDPLMAIVRPIAAFVAAFVAGVAENLFSKNYNTANAAPDLTCPVDACCDGVDCPPEEHAAHHGFGEKMLAGMRFAFVEVWADMAGWFFIGLVAAGFVVALLPPDILGQYLGGGIFAMLLMLAAGVPIYICATASTPIAAALILQGVSPGAALVFLLAGPATNVTSLTVLFGVLGKRAAAIYLVTIAVTAVVFGLAVDYIYSALNLSPIAMLGKAGEAVPQWIGIAGAVVLVLLSIKPVFAKLKALFFRQSSPVCHGHSCDCSHGNDLELKILK